MWLIPLVWGWFAIGTHRGRRRQIVEKLFERTGEITLPNNDPAEHLVIKICSPEIYKNRLLTKSQLFLDDTPPTGNGTIFGFSISGDELADGPFYNYARCSTWSYLTYKIIQVCASRTKQWSDSPEYIAPVSSQVTINDISKQLNAHYSIRHSDDNGYPENEGVLEECRIIQSGPLKKFGWKNFQERKTGSGTRKIRAFTMAFFLQGIFGWSAFMIDYMTPTIGIGCRALICMTYSLTSLFSCLFLILASYCSDTWSYQFERYNQDIETEDYTASEGGNRGARPSNILAVGAVGFRLFGKTLAILNAIFIVVGCILEFVGTYESCFCKSTHVGLGYRAFVSFLNSQESAEIARPYWYGGAGAAMLAVLVVCIGYFTHLPRVK